MASLKTEAVVLIFALILHVVSVSGECVDLDVNGCQNNPHLCHDDLLAEVTCPVTCNRCPTQPTTAPQPTQEPHSCLDIMRLGIGTSSGVYSVYAPISRRRVQLFCDLETDGGGWIVFQNRFNGAVDFFRPFADYEAGFGTKYGEFWLGLQLLSEFTTRGDLNELRVDVDIVNGTKSFDIYRPFSVAAGPDYTAQLGSRVGSHAMYPMNLDINGSKFSTYDHDMDINQLHNCAREEKGGWWYKACYYSNLNGDYHHNMLYFTFTTNWQMHYLKASKMMFRAF